MVSLLAVCFSGCVGDRRLRVDVWILWFVGGLLLCMIIFRLYI